MLNSKRPLVKYVYSGKDSAGRYIIADEHNQWIVAYVESERDAKLLALAPEMISLLKNADKAIESLMREVCKKGATDWGIVNETLCAISEIMKKAKE